ncbi:MAG: carbohydrate-binding domain-containing protein [Lachnospiraceae bacterium]
MKKKILQQLLLITVTTFTLLGVTGCGNNLGSSTGEAQLTTQASENATNNANENIISQNTATATEFQELTVYGDVVVKVSQADLNTAFDENADTLIQIQGSVVDIIGEGATVSGNQVVINREGTYVISGELADGQICINVGDQEKVHLVLNNVTLSCSTTAPIYCVNADKLILTLADGSVNTIYDGYAYVDEAVKGCIYSTCDLTINGNGSLTVIGNYNNGISCKDDIKILGGTLNVTAVNNGIKGNDSISIFGGDITVQGDDGLKSDNEDLDKGFLFINGGTVRITADDDAMQATNAVILSGGNIYARYLDTLIQCGGTVQGEDTVLSWM